MTSFPDLLNKINQYILNPLIYFLFIVAFFYFLLGLAQFMMNNTSDTGRTEGKRKMVWGLVGLFIMFSAYGIIHLILATFGLNSANTHQGYINF